MGLELVSEEEKRSPPAKEDAKLESTIVAGGETKALFEALKALRSRIGNIEARYALDRIPLFDWGGQFDPQRYFETFRLVRADDRYVIDYVCQWHGLGGRPLLYARKADSPRVGSVEEYERKFGSMKHQYLSHLAFGKSAGGVFQFALFCLEAPKFYLS